MIELTIRSFLNDWIVAPKHLSANRMINPTVVCSTFDEAKEVYQQLDGKKLQEIEAFIKLRNKLNASV